MSLRILTLVVMFLLSYLRLNNSKNTLVLETKHVIDIFLDYYINEFCLDRVEVAFLAYLSQVILK